MKQYWEAVIHHSGSRVWEKLHSWLRRRRLTISDWRISRQAPPTQVPMIDKMNTCNQNDTHLKCDWNKKLPKKGVSTMFHAFQWIKSRVKTSQWELPRLVEVDEHEAGFEQFLMIFLRQLNHRFALKRISVYFSTTCSVPNCFLISFFLNFLIICPLTLRSPILLIRIIWIRLFASKWPQITYN